MTNLLLALDYGERKTGLAICEVSKYSLARDLETVETRFLTKALRIIIQEKKKKEQFVRALVMGLPLNMDKTESKFTQKVKDYCTEIKTELAGITIFYEEERLTSWEARQDLFELGYSLLKVKELEHQVAAKIILNSFLARNKDRIPELF